MEFLVFVIFCVTIATLIVAASVNGKNKKTDQKIDSLNYAIGALHHKVDSLQRGESKQANAEKAQTTQTAKTVPTPAPTITQAQAQSQTPVDNPPPLSFYEPAPTQAPRQTATPTPQQKAPTQSTAAHMAAPAPAPMPAPRPAPAPASAPAQQQNVPVQSPQTRQQAPVQAPQTRPYTHTFSAPKSQANMEKIIGKNILPFLAAGMVFIGLIFLAILVVPTMSDIQRFIAMFALSGVIFAVGFVLARRKKNVFSVALLGTGIGALFISILMTRIYFNYLSDLPTFSLLLLWMIACMGLVKLFNSLTLSITAHIGMAISIIFAFVQGFDQQRALIVIAYQVVATIVIVGGSLLAYRKTYRFGLIASLALTVVATIAIRSQDLAEFSTSVIVTSYVIQFLTATVLSFFLATSSAKLAKEDRLAFHYINKLVWIVLAILALWPATYQGVLGAIHWDSVPSLPDSKALIANTVPTLVCIAVFIIHALVSALLERTIGMPEDMVRVSVIATISAAAVIALYRVTMTLDYGGTILLPFLFVFALISLGIARLLRDQVYTILATILLVIDVTIAVTSLYLAMSDMPVALAFIWIVAIIATSLAIYATWKPAEKRSSFVPVLILLTLIFFEVAFPQAIAIINATSLGWAISLAVVLLILTVLRVVNIEALMGMSKSNHAVFALNEYCVAFIAIVTVGMNGESATTAEQVLLWVATALVIVMSFVRIIQSRNISALHPQPIQYLSAIILTLATQAPLLGLVHVSEGARFVSSVVAMLIALVLVGMGFALRLKPVRLYGLGLTIFAVLKLATYDLSNISSVGRVIAFIVGGLIAFGISALYNYADKRLDPSRAGNQGSPTPALYPAMAQAGGPQGAPQPMTGNPATSQMPTGAQVPMTGQVPPASQVPMGAPVPTGQVPVQAQPVTAQPVMGQPPMPQANPAQPATGQPVTPQTTGNPQPPSALGTQQEDGR